jgi:hypothetical protein
MSNNKKNNKLIDTQYDEENNSIVKDILFLDTIIDENEKKQNSVLSYIYDKFKNIIACVKNNK